MDTKAYWDWWAKSHSGLNAVMVGSSLINKYRDWLENRILLRSIKVDSASILDIGCGNGRWLKRLEECGAKKLTGIDFSKELIDQGRKTCNADLYVMNSANLRFSNKSFDISLLLIMLPHDDRKTFEATLKEAARVTKKQIFILDEPNTPGAVWNERDIVAILKKSGFKLIRVRGVRSEWILRLLRRNNKNLKGKESVQIKTQIKTRLGHWIKIILEIPIDVLCKFFPQIAFEKLLVFESVIR